MGVSESILFISFLVFLQNVPIQRARIVYEKLIEFFPTFGKYWKLWAEHEVVFTPIFNNRGLLLVYISSFNHSVVMTVKILTGFEFKLLSILICMRINSGVLWCCWGR